MQKLSGSLLSGVFALLGLLHIYWAGGGQRGLSQVLPTQDGVRLLNPPSALTGMVAGACFGALGITLGRMGMWGQQVSSKYFRWGLWVISGLFLLRAIGDFRIVGFTKTITDTPFARWDTRLYSPLCIGIAVLAVLTNDVPDAVRRSMVSVTNRLWR